KTPDSILRKQLEVYDEVVKKYAAANPLFKEIVESQLAFAKRATQWEQDYVVNRRIAFEHYWGANAKKPIGPRVDHDNAPFGRGRMVLCLACPLEIFLISWGSDE